ncbi:hypothetical protein HanXRQr2_Chr05g0215801 [Helianthus annuus]|uniref:Uncharacterized protein n=1 Tax=Helianthus annuus TaxID=4232 RepID=A0A9K3J048_HELAN|nr:hypothetical protein HanXRQr2_Chr05g0215801 [Helianthus annuus]KAJ0922828.1 hypothetical protein HanPSC8_Chr05g0208341 [Helianthus annuus]
MLVSGYILLDGHSYQYLEWWSLLKVFSLMFTAIRGLVLFTDFTSQLDLANHLQAEYSMLIVLGVSRAQLRKVKSKSI